MNMHTRARAFVSEVLSWLGHICGLLQRVAFHIHCHLRFLLLVSEILNCSPGVRNHKARTWGTAGAQDVPKYDHRHHKAWY
jgi:hypothetical protein